MSTKLEQAAQDYVASAADRDVPTLTGRQLAERYGMSPRWGGLALQKGKKLRAEADDATFTADYKRPSGTLLEEWIDKPKAAVQPRKRTQDSRFVHAAAVTSAIIVGSVAFLMSYAHIRHLASMAGLGWHADIMALTLDGMLASCTLALMRHKSRALAWTGILVGGLGSVVANVLAVAPELADLHRVGMVLAVFPPLAFALSVHLVLAVVRK